jgi:tRNA(fMet)-specific endonuclease VapC
MQYLIDTDICIFFMKGIKSVGDRFAKAGSENCYISEITLAELKFGVENSSNPVKHRKVLADFLTGIQILPVFHSLDVYAKEKVRLRKAGTPLDDFDILIGATAMTYELTMVTNNKEHFSRINGIVVENWIQ